MKAAKSPKHLREMSYVPPKRKLLKRKGNSITPEKTNAPTSKTSSEGLKLQFKLIKSETKNLKMKLGKLQEEISKLSLPVSADLSNDFKLIILKTDRRNICSF